MLQELKTTITASISDLKKDPTGVVEAGEGEPIAILNRNKCVFYCVPTELYNSMLDQLEDNALIALVKSREGQNRIPVDPDSL